MTGQTVYQYKTTLEKLAKRLVELPSPYDFKRKFMEGLLPHMITHVTIIDKLSAEVNDLDVLYQSALALETQNQIYRSIKQAIRHNNGTDEVRTSPAGPTKPALKTRTQAPKQGQVRFSKSPPANVQRPAYSPPAVGNTNAQRPSARQNFPPGSCHNCGQDLIEIDNRGERLTGCLSCNLWARGAARDG